MVILKIQVYCDEELVNFIQDLKLYVTKNRINFRIKKLVVDKDGNVIRCGGKIVKSENIIFYPSYAKKASA